MGSGRVSQKLTETFYLSSYHDTECARNYQKTIKTHDDVEGFQWLVCKKKGLAWDFGNVRSYAAYGKSAYAWFKVQVLSMARLLKKLHVLRNVGSGYRVKYILVKPVFNTPIRFTLPWFGQVTI